jgi:hypothetical protein
MIVISRLHFRLLLASLIAISPLRATAGAEPTHGRNQDLFFEARIRPLLIDNCLKCHGEEKQKGGLRLDSQAAILKGGKKGLILTPGQPENSRIIAAVTYKDADLQMPPDDQLSDEQVRVLNEWVAMGAPWPASEPVLHVAAPRGKHRIVTEADRQFWSFQPVKNPPLPAVHDVAWRRNEIDQFVL